MTQTDEQLAEHVVVYTIALLPDVKDGDFEKHILEGGLPGFQLTRAHWGAFSLEHRFLKRVRSEDHADRYVWQIRLMRVMLVGDTTEDDMFAELDKVVRDRLTSFGIPVSRTILQEMGAAQNM